MSPRLISQSVIDVWWWIIPTRDRSMLAQIATAVWTIRGSRDAGGRKSFNQLNSAVSPITSAFMNALLLDTDIAPGVFFYIYFSASGVSYAFNIHRQNASSARLPVDIDWKYRAVNCRVAGEKAWFFFFHRYRISNPLPVFGRWIKPWILSFLICEIEIVNFTLCL